MTAKNLYVHFPFCRRKCTYCALHSKAGSKPPERQDYADRISKAIESLPDGVFSTVYFGGGSPALCDLRPVFKALEKRIDPDTEFTVELHPLDAKEQIFDTLRAGGVNRISMGVQSLDDGILASMGRGYGCSAAKRAFDLVKSRFENAGIDLIAGYPAPEGKRNLSEEMEKLSGWDLKHCSVYSLILEEKSTLASSPLAGSIPPEGEVLDDIARISGILAGMGLVRYEISNYAEPGFECRHNMSVWRGEDYLGIGEGAHGRVGLIRTRDWFGGNEGTEEVSSGYDAVERKIFSLRTREGLDAGPNREWHRILQGYVSEGLLTKEGTVYRLTARGTEVCDSILADLV